MDMQSNFTRGTRAFHAIWDGVDEDKLRAIFHDRFEFHNLDGRNDVTDLNGLIQRMATLRAAHPDAQLGLENGSASGSHVAFDWSLQDSISAGSGARGAGASPVLPDGSCMIRLDGYCVAELWELNGALAG